MTKHIICDILFYIFSRYNMEKKLNDNLNDNVSNLDDEILNLNIDHVTELNDNATEDAMQQYFKNISAYKPYTHEEEMELGYKIQQGDKEALKNLILANLKFVVSIANKYKNQDIPLLDLINQGNIGLLEAAKRYDPSKGTKFITYAVWWIKQAIIQAVNEQGSAVKMPVKHTAYLYKINSATEKLTKDLGKVPSIEEISKATDIPMEEIEEVLMASKSYLSLDNYIGNSEDAEIAKDAFFNNLTQNQNAILSQSGSNMTAGELATSLKAYAKGEVSLGIGVPGGTGAKASLGVEAAIGASLRQVGQNATSADFNRIMNEQIFNNVSQQVAFGKIKAEDFDKALEQAYDAYNNVLKDIAKGTGSMNPYTETDGMFDMPTNPSKK